MRALAIAAGLLLCGCIRGPERITPPPPAPVVDRAAICTEIAGYVDAGRLKTADDLVRLFALLKDAGRWSDADSAAVDQILPGLATRNTALTKDDAEKLRSVK